MHLVDATMFFCARGGGVRRYLLAKQAWLAAHAPQVRHTLLVPEQQARSAGVRICAGPALSLGNGYRFPLSIKSWRHALLELQPDLIEAGDPYVPAWAARDVARRLGIPVVAFFHSDLPRMLEKRIGRSATRPARTYLRNLYSGFDRVLAPSHVMLEKLNAMGVTNTGLQPLGVDTTVFHPVRRDANLRRELTLPDATRLLVYAGRFAREKHLDVLLDSVARLAAPYHLLLIGGRERARVSPHATVLPYEGNPCELARVLASCDAFVHAGDEETFGLVLIEAMACGLPVVAVASGGISELVVPSVGILAQHASAAQIAAAIEALFQRDLRTMGSSARQHVLAHYSWAAAFEQLLRHYAQLRNEPVPMSQALAYVEPG